MRNISRITLLMHLLTCAGLSFAASYPAQVPVTGETGGAAGSASGAAWPTSRFVAGSGATANCVTDKLTGLMWVKDLNTVLIKGGANGSATNWQNALDSVAQANSNQGYCGYKDWHLPNIIELKSLVNYGQSSPANWLNTMGFNNVQTRDWWSSTSSALNSGSAWLVSFSNGYVDAYSKTNHYYVWPVRRGQ